MTKDSPPSASTRCPHCHNRLLQKTVDGGIKLRTEGIHVFRRNGGCVGTCHWCKRQVAIPISLDDPSLLGDLVPPLTVPAKA